MTLHARQKNHLDAIKSKNPKNPLVKHKNNEHNGEIQPFTMKLISSHNSVLSRYVSESIYIDNFDKAHILNSKSEWGRGKLIRRTCEVIPS